MYMSTLYILKYLSKIVVKRLVHVINLKRTLNKSSLLIRQWVLFSIDLLSQIYNKFSLQLEDFLVWLPVNYNLALK